MIFDTPHQRLQRDLAWAVNSPDMMHISPALTAANICSISESPAAAQLSLWLSEKDRSSALRELVALRSPHRLGIYYEVLWQFIFESYPAFELITRNLPVLANKQTLGEMDFIYYCKQRERYIHLETAVKLYLGIPTTPDSPDEQSATRQWARWVGPGRKDRLDLKMDKMLGKQSQLSKTPAGIAALTDLGVTDVISEICLKGYFFYPLPRGCSAPRHSSSDHAFGYWLHIKDIQHCLEPGLWYVLSKEEWLSPVSSQTEAGLIDLASLSHYCRRHFNASYFPVMVAKLTCQNAGFVECSRYFIVPDDWLARPAPQSII